MAGDSSEARDCWAEWSVEEGVSSKCCSHIIGTHPEPKGK
jgi:hypothetical protein